MFGRTIKCNKCKSRTTLPSNIKYIKCDECGEVLTNKYFVEPQFESLEFSKVFTLSRWPESVFNIAKEMEKAIQKVELIGNNEVIAYYGIRVCQSKNETILLSNLTHLNKDLTKIARFNLKNATCSDFHKKCDYTCLCPLRAAVYLYLYRREYGDEAVKNARKLSKEEHSKNNISKTFDWDVNNHTSEYIPTKTLRFVEKILDNNYISFAHQSGEGNTVMCTSSMALSTKDIPYLISLPAKKLRETLTMDLESSLLCVSSIVTVDTLYLQHLAKYVEYLRRNHSYEAFYKRQLQKEREMAKANNSQQKYNVDFLT